MSDERTVGDALWGLVGWPAVHDLPEAIPGLTGDMPLDAFGCPLDIYREAEASGG